MSKNTLLNYLVKSFGALLLLFLCSVPVAYASVVGNTWQYLYIIMRAVRFVLALALAFLFRRRYYSSLNDNASMRKKVMMVAIVCLCISLPLHFNRTLEKLYFSISATAGIYNGVTNILAAVLWEELLKGDLYWCFLISLAVVFFRFGKADKKIA